MFAGDAHYVQFSQPHLKSEIRDRAHIFMPSAAINAVSDSHHQTGTLSESVGVNVGVKFFYEKYMFNINHLFIKF